ncbi:hypothetical protein ACFQMD_07615 [Streptomyces cirratus]
MARRLPLRRLPPGPRHPQRRPHRPAGHGTRGLRTGTPVGVLRAAQAENPGRFTVVDLDGEPESVAALAAAVASAEPEIAVRRGRSSSRATSQRPSGPPNRRCGIRPGPS